MTCDLSRNPPPLEWISPLVKRSFVSREETSVCSDLIDFFRKPIGCNRKSASVRSLWQNLVGNIEQKRNREKIMAEKLGLSNEVKEIKLGKSFMKGDSSCFHTFRYDFMPASLDNTTKRATIDIGEGHQVTVTVPHNEGSVTASTVFKGSKKPYQKECVLIINHDTGEITLEKLTYNVQLKKTRAEGSSKIRSNTPIDNNFINKKSPAQRLSPQQRTYPASFGRSSPVQKCSPLPKSPLGNQLSPNNNSNTIPSMPSLSMLSSKPFPEPVVENAPPKQENPDGPEIGVLSSSSSDSSSSDDSSESSSSDNEEEESVSKISQSMSNSLSWKDNPDPAIPSTSGTFSMPTANSLSSMPKFSQLSEDLKLSESDSDSDG